MPAQSGQIEIKYKSLDGKEHEAFIWPLKRKEGIKVLHTLIQTIGGLVLGSDIFSILKAIDLDVFMSIANPLLRNAVIDLKECKDLESFDGFNGSFTDVYVLTFKALEANYPDFFGLLAKGDSGGILPLKE